MDLVVPPMGESITEAVVGRWLKKVGDATAPDEPVVDLETDKVNVQVPAPAGGVLAEQLAAEGATVKVGQVIGKIQEGAAKPASQPVAATPAPAPTPAPSPAPAPVSAAPAPQVALSPHQRRMAREQGEGNGQTLAASSAPAAPAPPLAVRPAAPAGARDEAVPMSPLRKKIAERLVEAQHTAAILTTFNEVDMSAVMAARARWQDDFVARHGVKLGFMSFFAKAVIAALKDFPGLNAEIRGDAIIYKKHYDIGVAVGSGRGLVVPVLRDAEGMSFADIEKGIAALAQKVKEQKITLDDLAGGTFTITNGGIYGSMMSTPLLNMPQTGILGMHNIVKRAVVVGDAVQVRPMMYVALSYDHRVVDGREAVQFLVGVKERIENPDRLLFSL